VHKSSQRAIALHTASSRPPLHTDSVHSYTRAPSGSLLTPSSSHRHCSQLAKRAPQRVSAHTLLPTPCSPHTLMFGPALQPDPSPPQAASDFDPTSHADFGAATHPGVGGGTHRRHATFERCYVFVGGVRLGVWAVVLVVCVSVSGVLFSVGVCVCV